MTITALPTPPSRTDPANFAARGDAFLGALPTFASQANDMAAEINASAEIAAEQSTLASQRAAAAAASAVSAATASGATAWVSGTTYALGAVVYSTLSGRTYRRIVAGAGATDPSADTTNWRVLVLDIDTGYPTSRPSLVLDFAKSEAVDPRITFTRASTATYFDGKTFAKGDENLLTYSQEFDNAAWTKTTMTATANTDTAPDGTGTADTLAATAGNATFTQSLTLSPGDYTFSVYLRRKTGTGNIEISCGGGTWVTQTITSSWARYSVTQTITNGTRTPGVRIVTSGDEVYAWGAQIEIRSTLGPYRSTTTAPVSSYFAQLLTAGVDVPRIDHDPVTGQSLGLLIEQQSTNLLTYSTNMSTGWTRGTGATFTNDAAAAPDGTFTAISAVGLFGTGIFATGTVLYRSPITVTNATTYTFSVWVRGQPGNTVSLATRVTDGTNNTTITHSSIPTDRWVRVSHTWTSTTTPATVLIGTPSGTGNFFLWGAQFEAGEGATSYIPTVATQVTRNFDSAVVSGANFSSWFRADEYTVIATYGTSVPSGTGASATRGWAFSDAQANNRAVGLGHSFSTIGNNVSNGAATVGTDYLIYKPRGYSYKASRLFFAAGEGVTASDTSFTPPRGLNQLALGDNSPNVSTTLMQLNGHIQRFVFYPVCLADAQVVALTTP